MDLLPNLRSQFKSVKKLEEVAVGPFVVERVSKDKTKVYVKSLAPFPSKKSKQKAFDSTSVSICNTKKEPTMYERPSRCMTVDGEDHWIVEAILDKRNKQNRYLVKWQGFSYLESTWEPKECFPEDLIKKIGVGHSCTMNVLVLACFRVIGGSMPHNIYRMKKEIKKNYFE